MSSKNSSYGYGYGHISTRSAGMLGRNLGFSAAEAYKLLRTNLSFSITSDRHCKVVGITSAFRDEGKTTNSINLAYMIAESQKKVLLIDGDMRLPKIGRTLGLKGSPGLSNVLARLVEGEPPVQPSGMQENMYVLTSGDIPPNPSELLGSQPMVDLVRSLDEQFDYIIIDLPPVNIVSDALVLAEVCDGLLFMVRQDYTSKKDLISAVEQLHYCKARILGFVLTHASNKEGYYSKNYKHRGYYSSRKKNPYGGYYSSSYGDSYEHSVGNSRANGRGPVAEPVSQEKKTNSDKV